MITKNILRALIWVLFAYPSSAAEAHWKSKETWLTRLSPTELHSLLGLQKMPVVHLEFESIVPAIPSFFPQELFSCGGGTCDEGWMPEDAAHFLQNVGITDEACMPYTSGSTSLDAPCADRCRDFESRITRIANYTTPTSEGGSIDAVKNALNQGPLVTSLRVYSDFLTYGGGVYRHKSGSLIGGHAVSLVGYNDETRAWLVRNSWGTEWGENGFAWVSWDDTSGLGANTWAFEVTPPNGLAVNTPGDREYISGNYQLTAQGQSGNLNSLQFRITDSRGGDILTVPCTNMSGIQCFAHLDTTILPEGRYQVVVESSMSKSNGRSQFREFYVLNREPKMKLSLSPAQGTDLNEPVQGRVEFFIQAHASPVPIQFLEFHVSDAHGKAVLTKRNSFVLEQMKMGWRPEGLLSGKYQVQIRGQTQYLGKTYLVESNALNVNLGDPGRKAGLNESRELYDRI